MLSVIRKHKILFLIISMVVIYAVQFLLLPSVMPNYYPVSNEAFSILIIPLIIFSIVINIIVDVNIWIWAIVDVLYGVMIGIYNGMGLYGIGLRGVSLDGMSPSYSSELAMITILIIALALFVFQVLIRILRLVFLKIKKHKQIEN